MKDFLKTLELLFYLVAGVLAGVVSVFAFLAGEYDKATYFLVLAFFIRYLIDLD